jgi:hypothetical protein
MEVKNEFTKNANQEVPGTQYLILKTIKISNVSPEFPGSLVKGRNNN